MLWHFLLTFEVISVLLFYSTYQEFNVILKHTEFAHAALKQFNIMRSYGYMGNLIS